MAGSLDSPGVYNHAFLWQNVHSRKFSEHALDRPGVCVGTLSHRATHLATLKQRSLYHMWKFLCAFWTMYTKSAFWIEDKSGHLYSRESALVIYCICTGLTESSAHLMQRKLWAQNRTMYQNYVCALDNLRMVWTDGFGRIKCIRTINGAMYKTWPRISRVTILVKECFIGLDLNLRTGFATIVWRLASKWCDDVKTWKCDEHMILMRPPSWGPFQLLCLHARDSGRVTLNCSYIWSIFADPCYIFSTYDARLNWYFVLLKSLGFELCIDKRDNASEL